MISKKMAEALNGQINKELYSSYLYLAMAAGAVQAGYKGSGVWFKAQAQEEAGHAMKIYGYLESQGAQITLESIEKPEPPPAGLKDYFEATLAHEKVVTASIHELVALARSASDPATEIFLQWFVTEQVEEEGSVQDILDQLAMIGEGKQGLFLLDRELGQRGGAQH